MTKSTWTDEQCEKILKDYWNDYVATCPSDDSKLKMIESKEMSLDYRFLFSCPRCGESAQLTRSNDPKQKSFRKWTDEEIASLVDAVFKDELLDCPICGSDVEGQHKSELGEGSRGFVKLFCKRCGNRN